MATVRVYNLQTTIKAGSGVGSKADILNASLAGTGSIADRLYAQEDAAYAGPLSKPLSMNDLLVGNGHDKYQIQ